MAFTITEAHDVNALLSWILGLRPVGTTSTDEELEAEAKAAAEHLADKAYKALSAGLNSRRVQEAWENVEACPWQEAAAPGGGSDG